MKLCWIVLGLLCLLLLAGCGSSDGNEASPNATYMQIEKKFIKNDTSACEMINGNYKNKLAASTQEFAGSCAAIVKQVGKNLRETPDFQTKKIDHVVVKGNTATMIAHSTNEGKDVRTRVTMTRNASGDWILAADHALDSVAPAGAEAAYRAYSEAFATGEGAKACALSTERARELLIASVPKSHGGGTCSGAVPFLAEAGNGTPRADVVVGTESGDSARLDTLQSNGSGSWALRIAVMKRQHGKWLFDYLQDLGVAPPKRAPSGPVT